MSVEFFVFARFYGKDRQLYMKDCRRGFSTLEEATEKEAEFKAAGARTTMAAIERGNNVIFVRERFQ